MKVDVQVALLEEGMRGGMRESQCAGASKLLVCAERMRDCMRGEYAQVYAPIPVHAGCPLRLLRVLLLLLLLLLVLLSSLRSEERLVGKECRYRWSP